MNKHENPKKRYCLVAQQHGDCLTVSQEVLDAMREELREVIGKIETHWRRSDAKAFAQSVEWERFADCMLRLGREIEAVQAYREAALYCLYGVYYDYGDTHYPCFALRARFCELFGKAIVHAREDWRLWSLIGSDSVLGEIYRDYRRFDRLR